jgi:hypothetical protein
MAGQYSEGQRLQGSDGQVYVVRGGVPTPERAVSYPGTIVPPNPMRVQQQQREQARQDAADRRAADAEARANRADARAAAKDARQQQQEDGVAAPGDVNKTGEEYLATLPKPLAAQVKAMADGRVPYPVGAALRSPKMQELVAATMQYDPTYSAADSQTRVATRKKWTSGKGADNITAANTALGHLGALWEASKDLHNRSVPAWNAVANTFETATGDPRVKRFTLARDAVANELMKVFRGTGGSLAEIEDWKNNISSADSPEQLQAVIQQGIGLLNSRLEAMGQQYNQGMGHDSDPLTFLSPHALEVFNHLGPGGDMQLPPPGVGPDNGSGPTGGAPPPMTLNADPSVLASINGIDQAAANDSTTSAEHPATGETAYKYDAPVSQHMWAMWKAGKPYEEIAAYAQTNGYQMPPLPDQKSLDYAKVNKAYNPFRVGKEVPVSWRDQQGSKPWTAAATGAANAATFGLSDEIYGGISALGGNDYTTARDHFQGVKDARAELNPLSNLTGNMAGGAASMLLGGPISRVAGSTIGRLAPGAVQAVNAARAIPVVAKAEQIAAPFAPLASDVGYGAAYGAGENNQDRIAGAEGGAVAGLVGGALGRAGAKGLAGLIAPKVGALTPVYSEGIFPTLGQRFSAVNGGKGFIGALGRGVNTFEQALQSVPLAGGLVARARNIPREQWQVGGFNQALHDLHPFGNLPTSLPEGMTAGIDAHALAGQAFDHAYDRARSGMQFVPDQGYMQDLNGFSQRLDNGVLDQGQSAQVKNFLQNTVGSRLQATGGALPGDAYKAAASDIAAAKAAWGKNPNTAEMAHALGDYETIFDNAARRNSDPNAVMLLDAADSGYAKLVRIQRASELGGVKKDAGTYTPTSLAQADKQMSGGVRSNAWNKGQGLFQDYIAAGKHLEDTLGNSGSAERLMTGQAVTGGLGAMAHVPAALIAHPGALAPLAPYAPLMNHAVTRMIAPRDATLPPKLAAFLNNAAAKIDNAAPTIGRLAVPAVVDWRSQ